MVLRLYVDLSYTGRQYTHSDKNVDSFGTALANSAAGFSSFGRPHAVCFGSTSAGRLGVAFNRAALLTASSLRFAAAASVLVGAPP